MDFTGKKVLIAGGAGFIGTNLALALAARNARLRLTIHEKPLQAAIPGAEVLALDLRRPEHCARAVEGMDYVFLAAAHTSGAAVIRTTPLVHITPNVLINTLMLEAAHRAKVARFCFISSGAAYPPTADRPVREAGDVRRRSARGLLRGRLDEALRRNPVPHLRRKNRRSRCPPSWCGLPTSMAPTTSSTSLSATSRPP